MTPKEKYFEDIEYMKQVVQDSRNIVLHNGAGFILWGIIIVVCLVFTYIDTLVPGDQYSKYCWIILISAGWIYSFIESLRKRGTRGVVTFGVRILSATWIAAGISMTILGFIGAAAGAYHGIYISPILSVILGIAFFITAKVDNHKFLSFVGPIWWAGSIYMFIFPRIHSVLLMAFLMLFLQVVPGIILFKKYKAESKQDG